MPMTKPSKDSAITFEKDRQRLIEYAQSTSKLLIEHLKGATRDFELMQHLLNEYIGHLYAADVLAGYVDEKGDYKP